MYDEILHPFSLRFATYLSPVLYEVYAGITSYLGERIGYPTTLATGHSLDDFRTGNVDAGFLCGLLYTKAAHRPHCPVELLAAPVLQPQRYKGKPIYFSDVVVRKQSPIESLNDLHRYTWGYNEQESHSGWNLVCYSLSSYNSTQPLFRNMKQTGSHQRSIEMLIAGEIDATAIDSHVLDVLLLHNPYTASQLRIIETFGPSTIPPMVIAKNLDKNLKAEIQRILFSMHRDPYAAAILREGLIDRFVPVYDRDYELMYRMYMLVNKQENRRSPVTAGA